MQDPGAAANDSSHADVELAALELFAKDQIRLALFIASATMQLVRPLVEAHRRPAALHPIHAVFTAVKQRKLGSLDEKLR